MSGLPGSGLEASLRDPRPAAGGTGVADISGDSL